MKFACGRCERMCEEAELIQPPGDGAMICRACAEKLTGSSSSTTPMKTALIVGGVTVLACLVAVIVIVTRRPARDPQDDGRWHSTPGRNESQKPPSKEERIRGLYINGKTVPFPAIPQEGICSSPSGDRIEADRKALLDERERVSEASFRRVQIDNELAALDLKGQIPSLALGEFGKLRRVDILQILDGHKMLVMGVGAKLQDRDLIVEMVGWDTAGLVDGRSWKVPDDQRAAAVVGTCRYTTVQGGSKTVFVLIPLGMARRGLTIQEFKRMAIE